MLGVVRGAVSKEKRRYQLDGFDLDMGMNEYSNRIVAMGFPSEKMEAAFRNPMKEVLKLLDSKHKDHYKVYNLCSERGYVAEKFHNRVALYPFDDHNAPPFEMIRQFCIDVQAWFDADRENIAVIHCKAGKGRTGVMICAWFLYSRMCSTPEEALEYYAAARTYDQKGVTIPSQLRYVRYYYESLISDIPYTPRLLLLTKIIFHTLPKTFSVSDVDFKIYINKTEVFSYKHYLDVNKMKDEPKLQGGEAKKKKKEKKRDKDAANGKEVDALMEEPDTAEFECGTNGIPVCGDMKVDFERQGSRIFMFWVNTFFVLKDMQMVIEKQGLDKAHKDVKKHHKLYEEDFKVELQFAPILAESTDDGEHTTPS